MKTFTLYGLRKPGEEVRYIGVTSQTLKKRLRGHLFRKDGSTHKEAWISKMFREEKIRPEIVPYCVGLSKEAAGRMETLVIAELRRQKFDLVNLTAGGEGMTGWVPSEETRKRMSLSGRNRPPATLEARENIAASKRGKTREPFSPEWKKNLALSHTGIIRSDEWKKNLSIANTGKKLSEECKKKLSVINTGKTIPEEVREKIAASMRLVRERERQESYLSEMWGSRD